MRLRQVRPNRMRNGQDGTTTVGYRPSATVGCRPSTTVAIGRKARKGYADRSQTYLISNTHKHVHAAHVLSSMHGVYTATRQHARSTHTACTMHAQCMVCSMHTGWHAVGCMVVCSMGMGVWLSGRLHNEEWECDSGFFDACPCCLAVPAVGRHHLEHRVPATQ